MGTVIINAARIIFDLGFKIKTALQINTTIPQFMKYLRLLRVWVNAEPGFSNLR